MHCQGIIVQSRINAIDAAKTITDVITVATTACGGSRPDDQGKMGINESRTTNAIQTTNGSATSSGTNWRSINDLRAMVKNDPRAVKCFQTTVGSYECITTTAIAIAMMMHKVM